MNTLHETEFAELLRWELPEVQWAVGSGLVMCADDYAASGLVHAESATAFARWFHSIGHDAVTGHTDFREAVYDSGIDHMAAINKALGAAAASD